MSRALSTYFDLLRFMAALAVFLMHSRNLVASSIPLWLGSHGAEAVALFFVLSGFVIAYVTNVKEHDWRSYAVARLARVYSVAILALVVTFVADAIGTHISPQTYASLGFYKPESILSLLRAITFTSEIWKHHVVFGTNEPYWSLSFECLYYFIFGLFCFVRRPYNWAFAALALALTLPKIALYFPLWLLGVALYRHRQRVVSALSWSTALVLFAATPLVYWVLHSQIAPQTSAMFLWYIDPAQKLWTLVYFYSLGLLFAINLIAFDRLCRDRSPWPTGFANAIRWLAGVTFTLYLTHQPMLVMWNAIFAEDMPARTGLILSLTLAAVFLLGEIGERRKSIFVALFSRALSPTPLASSRARELSP